MARRPHEALVVVRRADRYLVLLRSAAGGGYWHLVAGGLEAGEGWRAAAARELAEETGLRVEVEELGFGFSYPPDEESGREVLPPGTERVEVRCFLAEAPAGWEPQLNDEHDEHRWCALDEARGLLRWPEPKALLEAVAAGRLP